MSGFFLGNLSVPHLRAGLVVKRVSRQGKAECNGVGVIRSSSKRIAYLGEPRHRRGYAGHLPSFNTTDRMRQHFVSAKKLLTGLLQRTRSQQHQFRFWIKLNIEERY